MKKTIKYVVLISTMITFALIVYMAFNYIYITDIEYQEPIGIIDTYLSNNYDRVTYYSDFSTDKTEKTHGDQLIEFARQINYNGDIYYYAAVDDTGEISTEKIIDGLNWMVTSNIQRVNISLSSKIHEHSLEVWIKEHPEVKVFCSYSNLLNTVADYPAMYENVIASGSDKRIGYKECDKHYRSNTILVLSSGIHKYEGNSYLSLYTLLSH